MFLINCILHVFYVSYLFLINIFILNLLGVTDALHSGDNDGAHIGQRILLPSSHQGSPRSMHQSYLDAMTIVQENGKIGRAHV